jgi:hypothetical protein
MTHFIIFHSKIIEKDGSRIQKSTVPHQLHVDPRGDFEVGGHGVSPWWQ